MYINGWYWFALGMRAYLLTLFVVGISGAACPAGSTNGTAATGGNVTYDVAGYYVHTFTGNGSIVFTQNTYVDVLVGGGGGGGGVSFGSGGGAGAVIYYPQYIFSAGTYTVTVASVSSSGTAGGNSAISRGSAFIFTAIGGGYGGGPSNGSPSTGGSGGGANDAVSWSWQATALGSTFSTSNVVAGITGQSPSNSIYVRGTAGGTIAVSGSNYCQGYFPFMCGGAGGGGAGASPGSITPATCTSAQVGGPGINGMNGYNFSAVFGVAYTSIAQNVSYIGGGGAGGGGDCSAATVLGGIGGGGSGNMASDYTGGAAIANTCSGGGGSSVGSAIGGAGASGLVMLRYQPCQACPAGSFAASMGSPVCTACPANTFSVTGSSACAACPVGSSSVAGSTACVAAAGYYDLGQSLLAYYTFDAAIMTADSAPNPLGPLTASTTPPVVGVGQWTGSNAAVFGGGAQYVIPTFVWPYSGALTLCAWYMTTATTGGWDIMIKLGETGARSSLLLSRSAASNDLFVKWNDRTDGSTCWPNGGFFVASIWNHVCAVAYNNNNSGAVYLNGVLYAAVIAGVGYQGPTSTNQLGGSFVGSMDEVRLYPRALSAAEVSAVYSYTGNMTTAVMPMICPVGSYSSSTGSSACTTCPLGSYANVAGLSACTPCQPGSSSLEGASACYDIPGYCGRGRLLFTNNNTCAKCPSGTVCPYQSGCSPSCLNCTTVGMIVDVNSNQSQCVSGVCNVCPVGGYCTSGTLFTNCSAGTFNNISGATTVAACSPCIPGSYAAAGQSACLACTAGSKSLAGSSNCSVCLAGSMSLASSSACTACTPGSYSAAGQGACSPCTAGSISALAGSSACSPCPTGSYAGPANSTCSPCLAGAFAPTQGLSVCTLCSAGYVSLGNASVCVGCQPGYYVTNQGSSVCTPCNAGYFSAALNATSIATCVACPVGQYSTQITASISCALCTVSTYQPNQGAQTISNCSACIPNSVTLAQAASAPTQCICDIGYFGQSGVSCTACPPGSYADSQGMSACTLCVANTVDAQAIVYPRSSFMGTCTDLSGILTKVTSPPGSTCQNASCAAGRYRSSNTCSSLTFGLTQIDAFCIPCTVNQYSLNGSTSCSNCINATTANALPGASPEACICLPGYFRYLTNSSTCAICDNNKWCAGGNLLPASCQSNSHTPQGAKSNSSCMCDAGYFGGNSTVASCSSCVQGYYCPYEATSLVLCPANTTSYPNSKAQKDCYCIPGYTIANSSASINGSACVQCNSSQFCTGGIPGMCPLNSFVPQGVLGVTSLNCVCLPGFFPYSIGNCTLCPFNSVCLFNVSTPTLCPPGSQTQRGQSSLAACTCNAGYYNLGNASTPPNCTLCPQNTFCLGGNSPLVTGNCQAYSAAPVGSTTSAACYCNIGYYGSGLCVLCPAGFYTLVSTNAASCLACSPGFFSASQPAVGASACQQCSAGYYSPLPNSTACTPCGLGTWSASIGAPLSSTCTLCGTGTYQSISGLNTSTGCLGCIKGTFGTGTGLVAVTQCTNCDPGTFQNQIAQNAISSCQNCSRGTYSATPALSSSTGCLLCPAASFSTGTGMIAQTQCQGCAAGTFTSALGLNSSSFCVACFAGSFSNKSTQISNATCLGCISGTYSTALGANSSTTCQFCPGGTYSNISSASSNATCALCPAGHFQSGIGMISLAACIDCPAGTFSVVSGLAGNCTLCIPGSFSTAIAAVSMSTCQYCGTGTFATALGANSSSTCSPCLAGSFSGLGYSNCAVCSVGQLLKSSP